MFKKLSKRFKEKVNLQRWYTVVDLCVKDEFKITVIALVDSGADMNCIQEGIIPTKYYEKTANRLSGANGSPSNINTKLQTFIYVKKDIVTILL